MTINISNLSSRQSTVSIDSALTQTIYGAMVGTLNIRGGLTQHLTVPGAYPYTILSSDNIILASSSAPHTVLLPASPSTGNTYAVKDITGTAGTNNITVDGNGHNIDGASTYIMNVNNQGAGFIYSGSQWIVGSASSSIALPLSLANGGTGAALTANTGGIFYSGASAGAILAGNATASKMLLSGATAAPTWSTSTIPTSAGATANKVLLSDGTNYVLSTPTFPNASATTRKIIVSDGTNWVASTETYAVPGTSGNVMTSNGTNWTSAAPATAGTVTSVAMTVPTFLSIGGSPITSSGTLAVTLSGTALPIANGGTAVTSVTISPTATSFAGWDANANLSADSFIAGYATTATAAGTTTLTVNDKQQQYFTGSTTQTVVMPVTSTLVLGQTYTIVNLSSGVVTVQSSGANTIQAMAANTQLVLTCILTSGTTAASWSTTYQTTALAASGISTLNGNSGSATGSTVTVTTGASQNSGSSFNFSGSSSTMTLNVTDASQNTIIGNLAGNGTLSGINNTGYGYKALQALTNSNSNSAFGFQTLFKCTSGQFNTGVGVNSLSALTTTAQNVAIGFSAGASLVTGAYNIFIGVNAGTNYTGSESSNIIITGTGTTGTLGESNVLRIGQGTGTGNGNLNKAFIAGINGVTASNQVMMTINSSTDQLGVLSTTGSGNAVLATSPTLVTPALGAATATSINFGGTTLSTYAEGTFTPTLVGGTVAGSTTYVAQSGSYTRIGNLVTVFINLQISAATGTGTVTIGGLPFTVKNQVPTASGSITINASGWAFPAGCTYLTSYGIVNSTTMIIFGCGSLVAVTGLSMTNAAGTFIITLTYQI